MLEKRVRSRFNHRSIFLREGNTPSLASFSSSCLKALSIPPFIDALPLSFVEEFNERIENLFSDSSELVNALRTYYFVFESPYQMLQKLLPAIYALSTVEPFISAACVKSALATQLVDQHHQAIQGLTIFHISPRIGHY